MHDAAALERKSLPTAVVAHHTFAYAAEVQARTLGLPGLPIAVMPRPDPSWTLERTAQVIADLAALVEPALTKPEPLAVQPG